MISNYLIARTLPTKFVRICIALEAEYWQLLTKMSGQQQTTVAALVSKILSMGGTQPRASRIRVHVAQYFYVTAERNGVHLTTGEVISDGDEMANLAPLANVAVTPGLSATIDRSLKRNIIGIQ